MHIGCTLPLYLCFVNEPKGLRQVNPKFNFCVMNKQKKVFGDFEISLRFEDCEEMPHLKWYWIECWDLRFSVYMMIEMRGIDKRESITIEDAVSKVKEYFRCRLDNNAWWENFARP